MNDYDDLDGYTGDAEHDIWVDYDYNANTGELSDYFDEDEDDYEEDDYGDDLEE